MEVLGKLNFFLCPKEKLHNEYSIVIASKKELTQYPYLKINPDDIDFERFCIVASYIDYYDKNKVNVIETAVLEYFEVQKEEIQTGNRKPEVVLPRQNLYYYLKTRCKRLSYRMIGEKYLKKHEAFNHATVLHGKKKIENCLEIGDTEITKYINDINFILNGSIN